MNVHVIMNWLPVNFFGKRSLNRVHARKVAIYVVNTHDYNDN